MLADAKMVEGIDCPENTSGLVRGRRNGLHCSAACVPQAGLGVQMQAVGLPVVAFEGQMQHTGRVGSSHGHGAISVDCMHNLSTKVVHSHEKNSKNEISMARSRRF